MKSLKVVAGLALMAALSLPVRVIADEDPSTADDSSGSGSVSTAPRPFHFGGEVKTNFRDSRSLQALDPFPFPPSFIPTGESAVFMRTTSPGSALELSNVALIGEGELFSGVEAKVSVHFLDLYNRNPVSTDERISVREAWIRLGRFDAALSPSTGTSAYLLIGQAPRFSKQLVRRMESYGLWGTAVARFENPQVQAGGFLGKHFYWRLQGGSGNPLFFRDPNALAGDNGTFDRVPGNVRPILQSGFPILYDAKNSALDLNGRFEWGAGIGTRFHRGQTDAVDVLGWYFKRDMDDTVSLPGTFYSGDLKLLRGPGLPLPFVGRSKSELGVNLEARISDLRLFGQFVKQEIAELPRKGFELEAAWAYETGGLFLIKETPAINWIQPVVRFSLIDNDFTAPTAYPAPTVAWDWRKLDLGVRVGVVRDVHLTIERAFNYANTGTTTLHPDETLVTLRVGF